VPPRKKASAAPPPLTDSDVATLRDRVKSGEKPRVIVRAASAAVPAGTRGNIVRVGNPSEGEFIVVRLGRDEVPFAPSELAVTSRTKNGSAPAPGAAAAKPAAAKKAPAAAAASAAGRRPATQPTATQPTATKPTAAKPAKAARAAKRRPAPRRTPPPLTVTLRFAEGQWSVEASRGARRLAKPSALRPGAVKAFADLVDEVQVREALTETVESCRAVVEERAAALRQQLNAAEAALKEYEARRR
jgi:hypothetical protein